MESANIEEWICKKESLSELGACMSHLSSSPSYYYYLINPVVVIPLHYSAFFLLCDMG
jgi:hypothetical protein